ncbi:MAG: biotin synthase BioB [Bacteroidales bacterium]|nr:biotin synthase BioB [Bacteroidales bacterium]
MNFAQIKELKEKIFQGYKITAEEAFALSKTDNIEALYYSANQIRAKFNGKKFEMCSLIKVESTKCTEDCLWCTHGTKSKTPIKEYDIINKDKAIEIALNYTSRGVKRISLSSTSKAFTDNKLDKVIDIYKAIQEKCNPKFCGALGHLTREQLLKLKKETKVTRLQCNLETSPNIYPKLCTTDTFEAKIATLKLAKELGFELCCGLIIGMGENMKDRIDLAIIIRDLGVKSIPIGILTPQIGIPLENQPKLASEEILTTIAIYRFINPTADIRLSGGRSLIKIIENEALRAGINSSMVGHMLSTEISCEIEDDKEKFEKEGFKL